MSKEKALSVRQPARPVLLASVSRSQSFPSSATSTATVDSATLDDGISGSAMAVPPPKAASYSIRPDNAGKASKGSPRKSLIASKSDTSNCSVKQTKEVTDRSHELKDALTREKQLLEQVKRLQQLVDSLQTELRSSKRQNEDLKECITKMENEHKTAIQDETAHRSKVEKELEEKAKQLATSINDKMVLDERIKELQTLTNKLQEELSDMKTQKDAEIADRDRKLLRLKKQMADSLTDNSRERQQQLDELSKNLEKVQEEADILRTQLRNVQRSAQDSCSNCRKMAAKMASIESASKASERTIKNLKDVIASHDKQPSGETLRQSTVDVNKHQPTSKPAK